VVQQLSHVSAENAWLVICAGFAPVPGSAAARPQFDVPESAKSLYFNEAPTVVDHPGRRFAHTREASAYAHRYQLVELTALMTSCRSGSVAQVQGFHTLLAPRAPSTKIRSATSSSCPLTATHHQLSAAT
jgi:hypothetical protein